MMGLSILDRWVWDFWLAQNGAEQHIFYLQAPRSLIDPDLRHHRATVGHAVSLDFEHWRLLPDALGPGAPGEWDDMAIWTGSVLGHPGEWRMLYTGISKVEDGRVQRIGLAESNDLVHWEKHGENPVMEADPRWYQRIGKGSAPDEAWRDPYLVAAGSDGVSHALITARAIGQPAHTAGTIGHARSTDLISWEVLPPLAAPAEFAQMEVPQLLGSADGPVAVLFSCRAADHSEARKQRPGVQACSGTFVMWAPRLSGPWVVSDVPIGAGTPFGPLYAGKVVTNVHGDPAFMGFLADDAEFTGDILGPFVGPEFALPGPITSRAATSSGPD